MTSRDLLLRLSLSLSLLLATECALAEAPPSGIGFAAVKKLIADHRLTSIEQLLQYFPITMRTRYALMFNSRSLQGASFRNPRVILFASDGKFIATFNGGPDQRGYHDVEVMEFNDDRAEFEFHEIQFPPTYDQNAEVVFSAANPPRCLICHGTPPRPVWDTFPTWPGAYGERYLAHLSKSENEGLSDFLGHQASHPRYRHLVGAYALAEPDAFYPSVQTRYGGTERETTNSQLTTLLGRLNFMAIVRQVRRAPEFGRYQFALLAALEQDCGEVEDFVPGDVIRGYAWNDAEFAASADQSNRRQLELKGLRTQAKDYDHTSFTKVETLARFRYLVEQGLGISTQQWTMALEKSTFDFSLPRGARGELEQLLLNEIPPDEKLRNMMSLRNVSNSRKYCRYLAERSRASLATKR